MRRLAVVCWATSAVIWGGIAGINLDRGNHRLAAVDGSIAALDLVVAGISVRASAPRREDSDAPTIR